MKIIRDQHDRRLFKMPEAICKPAASTSKVIVEHAMACAMKEVLPKSVTKKGGELLQTASKYLGILGLGKMNFIDKMRSGKQKAVELVEDKLLGALGCPVQKRRLSFWSSIKSGVSSIGSGLKKAASFAASTAKKVATEGAKVMKQFDGVIKSGACMVIKKYCEPACVKVADKLKDALKKLKISGDCMKEAFTAGCATLCSTICAKKVLKITVKTKKAVKRLTIVGKNGAGINHESWWTPTLDFYGDVEAGFLADYTAAFNGVAKNRMVDVNSFFSLKAKFNASRATLKHEKIKMPFKKLQAFWVKENIAKKIDVLTAVRLAWMLCNDG